MNVLQCNPRSYAAGNVLIATSKAEPTCRKMRSLITIKSGPSIWTWGLLRDPCLTKLRLEGMLKDASSLGVRQVATDVGLCVS